MAGWRLSLNLNWTELRIMRLDHRAIGGDMRSKEFCMLILAACCGFIGGTLSNKAQTIHADSDTVRASRFELVNKAGTPVAFWGLGADQGPVLTFTNATGGQVVSMGVDGPDYPFLKFNAPDGKPRLELRLFEHYKPEMAMSDADWEGRIVLGFMGSDYPAPEDDNWALRFGARPTHSLANPNLAVIGMFRDTHTKALSGHLFLQRSDGKTWTAPRN